jgi:hypothetical protein
MNSVRDFLPYTKTMTNPKVLELGTKRSKPERSTMHKHYVPHAMVYHGTDIEAGQDVDIVADLHKLTDVIPEESYDIVISCSTFEHLKYPHLAAFNISKILKPMGCLYIQTHFSFVLHSYPYDYFRFSKEALSGCFGTKNGIKVIATDYEFPCKIVSKELGEQGSWLNTVLFGVKYEKTPENYIYELDTNL